MLVIKVFIVCTNLSIVASRQINVTLENSRHDSFDDTNFWTRAVLLFTAPGYNMQLKNDGDLEYDDKYE